MAEERQIALAEFFEFVAHQCDEETALEFLKGNNFDVEQAVGAWYDNPDPSRYTPAPIPAKWDESSWSLDRLGDYGQSADVPSFRIDDGDDYSSLQPLVAPSRPPSRNSPLSSSQQAFRVTSSDSQAEAGNPVSKQTIIKASTNASESEESDPTDSQYASVDDCSPGHRAAEKDEPAFLKPLRLADHLPSVISILHSIPLCRNAFLARSHVSHQYPYEHFWWNGQVPAALRRVKMHVPINEKHKRELIHEMQLLMSFLDETERSYGSVSSLCHLPIMNQEGEVMQPLYLRLLKAWDLAMNDLIPGSQPSLFGSLECLSSGVAWRMTRSYSMDLGFVRFSEIERPTLYDVLDGFFWGESGTNIKAAAEYRGIESPAPVMLMSFAGYHHGTTRVSIKIPETWFADRYLSTHREDILNMKETIKECDNITQKIDMNLERLQIFYESSTGEKLKSTNALKITLKHMEERLQLEGGPKDARIENTLTQLSSVLFLLEDQTRKLQQEKRRVQEEMNFASKIFIEPRETQARSPSAEYSLRGLAKISSSGCTSTFLIAPTKARGEKDINDSSNESWQWWHLTYDTSGEQISISKQKVSTEEVLETAGELDCSTLLVYASKAVLNYSEILDVPESLEAFVQEDNKAFRAELLSEERKHVNQGYDLDTNTPLVDLTTIAGGHQVPIETNTAMADEVFQNSDIIEDEKEVPSPLHVQ